jgi:methionine biosynthesis protein MetW
MNDNRNYIYGENSEVSVRPEYSYIEKWVTEGAKVIDLGCGNGSLLALLKKKKGISEFGIEITESGVTSCLKKGINARVGRIDVELKDINDDAFDYAICNVTLQMVMYPEVTLKEMKRIARYQIISFPNFAYLPNRMEMFFKGRMPRRLLGGYDWFNTGHIHQFSIKDFKETVTNLKGLKIKKCCYYGGMKRLNIIAPNLLTAGAIFLTEKQV